MFLLYTSCLCLLPVFVGASAWVWHCYFLRAPVAQPHRPPPPPPRAIHLCWRLHLPAPWAAAAPPALPPHLIESPPALPFFPCKLDPNLKCRATDQAAVLDDLGVGTCCSKSVRLAFSTRHKKTKKKSTQQTNRTCTVIYYHGSRKCARISAHFQGKFLVKENSKRQGPQCFSDLRSPIQNHKNIQLPLRWLSSCKSLNTKWHTFVKKLRWRNISLKTYCLQEISRI